MAGLVLAWVVPGDSSASGGDYYGDGSTKPQNPPRSLYKIHRLNYLHIVFARLFLTAKENKIILSPKKEQTTHVIL